MKGPASIPTSCHILDPIMDVHSLSFRRLCCKPAPQLGFMGYQFHCFIFIFSTWEFSLFLLSSDNLLLNFISHFCLSVAKIGEVALADSTILLKIWVLESLSMPLFHRNYLFSSPSSPSLPLFSISLLFPHLTCWVSFVRKKEITYRWIGDLFVFKPVSSGPRCFLWAQIIYSFPFIYNDQFY